MQAEGHCNWKISLKNPLLSFSVLKNRLGKEILVLLIETHFCCKLEKTQLESVQHQWGDTMVGQIGPPILNSHKLKSKV